MKKTVFIPLFLCLFAFLLYADDKSDMGNRIIVKSVTGNVKYETSKGIWEDVDVDTLLNTESIINTGISSLLILETINKESVTIQAMEKGLIKDFIALGKKGFSGIKLDGSLTISNANADDIQERTNIGTASTRASEATEDLEWVKEDDL